MNAFLNYFLAFILGVFCLLNPVCGETNAISGFVFDDQNHNLQRDEGEPGIPKVLVSNGLDIVSTNDEGKYTIELREHSALFVIKPRDWSVPLNAFNLPQFYRLHPLQNTPHLKYGGIEVSDSLKEPVNFPLTHTPEPDRFKVLYLGDSQTENQQEIDWYAHDIIEELVGIKGIAFASSLGDIVNDDLSLFDAINELNAMIGVPMFNLFGNHDMDFDAKSDESSDDTFTSVFGPPNYFFQYGSVHFVYLDNILFEPRKEGAHYPSYIGGFRDDILKLFENYLMRVPRDELVVIASHIPLFEPEEWGNTFVDEDRKKLFELLEQHPHTLSLSSHTHTQRHHFFREDEGWPQEKAHHHYNVGTSCGSWWTGFPDERGIPINMMRDGTPNGYAFIEFDENQYVIDWKVAGKGVEFVMNIDAPEVVRKGEYPVAALSVNVFNGSERTNVYCRFNQESEWTEMKRTPRYDPVVMKIWARYEMSHEGLPGRRMNAPDLCHHLWSIPIPNRGKPGLQSAEVKVVDAYGRTHFGHRTWRLIEAGF